MRGANRGVQIGCYQDFQYLMVSIHFFHEVTTLMQSFMSDKLQSRKKIFLNVFDRKTFLYP